MRVRISVHVYYVVVLVTWNSDDVCVFVFGLFVVIDAVLIAGMSVSVYVHTLSIGVSVCYKSLHKHLADLSIFVYVRYIRTHTASDRIPLDW